MWSRWGTPGALYGVLYGALTHTGHLRGRVGAGAVDGAHVHGLAVQVGAQRREQHVGLPCEGQRW